MKFREKLSLLKVEPTICYLVILNSHCFSNQSFKDLDFTYSYNKYDKILLN